MIEILKRKMIKASNPIRFKIYFSSRFAYLKIFIWKNCNDMWAGSGCLANGGNYNACFSPSSKGKYCFGEIHFCREHLTNAIIAHELLHAIWDMNYKLGKRKLNITGPYERNSSSNNKWLEYLCEELEYLINGIEYQLDKYHLKH